MVHSIQRTGVLLTLAVLAQASLPLAAGLTSSRPCQRKRQTALVLGGLATALARAGAAGIPAFDPAPLPPRAEPVAGRLVPWIDLGLAEPAGAAPTLLERAQATYPGNACPSQRRTLAGEQPAHCKAALPLDPPLDQEESTRVSASLAQDFMSQEYDLHADMAVLNLEDCVCRALWADSGPSLLERLRETRGRYEALGRDIADYRAIRQRLWEQMDEVMSRWDEPGDFEPTPAEVPFSVRLRIIHDGLERMERARTTYRETVVPLLVELKRKAPKAKAEPEREEEHRQSSTPPRQRRSGPRVTS